MDGQAPGAPLTVVASKLEGLRKRLLDSSHRNPLIKVPLRANGATVVRFVDVVPDALLQALDSRTPISLASLTSLDMPLPDERSPEFKAAVEHAQTTDSIYLNAWAEFDDLNPATPARQMAIERGLWERVRLSLGMPTRPSEKIPNPRIHAELLGINPSYELPRGEERVARREGDPLQTLLLPEKLARAARTIHEKGHLFEQELGINVLHVAVGILDWADSKAAQAQRVANSPLLLVPIRTERRQTTRGAEYSLIGDGEPMVNTTLLRILEDEYGIVLPMYDPGQSAEVYFHRLKALAPQDWVWSVRREAVAGLFPQARLAMYADLDPGAGHLLQSPLVRDLLTSRKGDTPSFGEIYPIDAPEVAAKVPHIVLDADSSQVSTLVDIADGHSMAVEGPPGTGKSQTIVNIIASALHAGKKVLFVAEKSTALDVVYSRLASVGLGPFVLSLQTDAGARHRVFGQLEERLSLEQAPTDEAAAFWARHRVLVARREEMQAYLDVLSQPVGKTGWSVYDVLGRSLATDSRLEGVPRALRHIPLPVAQGLTPQDRAVLLDHLALMGARLVRGDRVASFWWKAQACPMRRQEADELAHDLSVCLEQVRAFEEGLVRSPLKACVEGDVFGVDLSVWLSAAQALEEENGAEISAVSPPGMSPIHSLLVQKFEGVATEVLQQALGVAYAEGGKLDIEDMSVRVGHLSGQSADLAARLADPHLLPEKVEEIRNRRAQVLADLGALRARVATVRQWEPCLSGLLPLPVGALEEILRIRSLPSSVSGTPRGGFSPPAVLTPLFKDLGNLSRIALERRRESLAGIIREFCQDRARVEQAATAVLASLGVEVPPGMSAAAFIDAHAPAITEAVAQPEGLLERGRLASVQRVLETHGLEGVWEWLCGAPDMAAQLDLPQLVESLLDRALLRDVEGAHAAVLDRYDGMDLDRLRAEIAAIDADLLKMSPAVIRAGLLERCHPPVGNTKGSARDYTEMGLINNERAKSRRHIPVRDLAVRAGRALLELQPCWMMSPLSVAQYLAPGVGFDLVVIDEASQMTPENALGAIARGRQVVVVGDTKQLPPTAFFQKAGDDDAEDDDAREDCESILDMAAQTFAKSRQLQWHYRSRHPDLIAFSNSFIYDSKLTVFPAARAEDPELGVHLVEVDGFYQNGTNPNEAHSVVEGVIAHMRDYPDLSLGVATMNKAQATLIGDLFEEARARHPHVQSYVDAWLHQDGGMEEFFVKNLETIQGDERDVIIISTVYGPDPQSRKVYQRFGPINGAHGHRRLNVLFSRAKRRIITHSSMRASDIEVEGKPQGVVMLRGWLDYARTRALPKAGAGARHHHSQECRFLESHLAKCIEEAGFEAVPVVGISGHSISIGVRHADWPYGYILGVECDGDGFRGEVSCRDRDRLRDAALQGLGWDIYRLWSIDWYRDSKTQRARLEEALRQALVRVRQQEEVAQQAREVLLAQRLAQAEEEAARRAEIERMLLEEAGDVSVSIEEMGPYDVLMRRQTTRKRTLYWMGFLEGVLASGDIEAREWEAVCHEAREVDRFFAPVVATTIESDLDRCAAGAASRSEGVRAYYDAIRVSIWEGDEQDWNPETDAINEFLGFCAGVICDGVVTTSEVVHLAARLRSSNILSQNTIFAQLRWSVENTLKEGPWTEGKGEEIREWLAALVTDGYALTGVSNIGGVMRSDDPITDPAQIRMEGSVFVLTGRMSIGPRSFIQEQIERRGGIFRDTMSEEVDYLVVSNTASRHWRTTHFGTKIESARRKVEKGHALRFVNESALAQLLQQGPMA